MALSKLHLAIVAVTASGMLWIEHGNRIVIATPAAAEAVPAAASVCPDTDDVPFSADCLAFIDGGVLPDLHSRLRPAASTAAISPMARARAELHAPACPSSNENAPYSAECIEFLSGWYWQANPTENAP
jgi:hypothetical protein